MVLPKDKVNEVDKEQKSVVNVKQVLESAYNRYRNKLIKRAAEKLGNAQSAKDAVMETFMKAMRTPECLNAENHLEAYLFAAIDETCDKRIQQQQADKKRIEEFEYISSQEDETDLEAELNELIRQQIDKLPPGRKQFVEKIFLEGLSSRQVADRMELCRKAINKQKVGAFTAMRNILLKRFL